MSDDRALIAERDRGSKARQVLDNPIWQETVAMLESNLRAHMENATATDDAVLEARRGLIVLRKIRGAIESVMTTGKMAEMQLERSENG